MQDLHDFLNRRVLVADTETTNLEKPEVCQFAWIELEPSAHISGWFVLPDKEGANLMGNYGNRKPKGPMSVGALATHHILPQELENEVEFDWDRDVAGGDKVLLIGHNIDFDWLAFGSPPDTPRICTLAMAQRIWPELDSHKLTALMYHVKGINEVTRAVVQDAHSANHDVMMTYLVLLALLDVRPELRTWAQVWEFSEDARLPRKWTFGKFEGRPLREADTGYMAWFHRSCTDRPDYQYYAKALQLAKEGKLAP